MSDQGSYASSAFDHGQPPPRSQSSQPQPPPAPIPGWEQLFRPRMGLRHLIPFLRRSATAIHAGIDVRRLWELEAKRAPAKFRTPFREIYQRVSDGDTIAEAMAAQGELFPTMVRELVDVGEKTGRLEQVLQQLADQYDQMAKLKRAFVAGITWPMIQLMGAITIITFLIWFMGEVLPAMGGQAVDLLGFGLVGNSGVVKFLGGLSFLAFGFAFLVFGVLRQWFGDLPIRLFLRIPYLGGTIQTMALARMTWTLSMALESGVSAQKSMKMALKNSHLPHFIALTNDVDTNLQAGNEFHEALRKTDRFPSEFLNMLETAELSGQLSESMIRLSHEYSQRAEASTKILVTFATFGIWGLVATFIIILIFRLAMFYLGTLNDALKAANGF